MTTKNCVESVRRHLTKLSRRSWKRFCSSVFPYTRVTLIWPVVKSLSSPVTQTCPFQALALHKGTDKLQLAADYCRLVLRPSTASSTSLRQASVDEAAQALSAECRVKDGPIDEDFSLRELQATVDACRHRSSPGPDRISYKALASLWPFALNMMLDFINQTWREGVFHESWTTGQLVYVLKPQKSSSELDSFRPVCLTSCLCKLTERIILNRMEWYLETNHLLQHVTAGFRKSRCKWVVYSTWLLLLKKNGLMDV